MITTKRKLIMLGLVALPMLALAASAADLSVSAGDTEVTLHDTACSNKAVLDWIKPQFHGRFQAGTVVFEKQKLAFCWTVSDTPGQIFIVDESGAGLELPMAMFAPKPSI